MVFMQNCINTKVNFITLTRVEKRGTQSEKLNLIIIDSRESYTIKNQNQVKRFQFIDEIAIAEVFEDTTGRYN